MSDFASAVPSDTSTTSSLGAIARQSIEPRFTRALPGSIAEEVQSWLALQEVDIGSRGSQQNAASDTSSLGTDHSGRFADGAQVVGLRKWIGQIDHVAENLVTVLLHPADHDGPDLVADFDARLLGPNRSAVRAGAVVYLTTRMVQDDFGYVDAMTQLRLRRPMRWSKAELEEVRRHSQARARKFSEHANRGAGS